MAPSLPGAPNSLATLFTSYLSLFISMLSNCEKNLPGPQSLIETYNQVKSVLIIFRLRHSSKKSTHKIELMLIIYGTVNSYSLSISLNKHLNKGPRLLCLECHVTGYHPHPKQKAPGLSLGYV